MKCIIYKISKEGKDESYIGSTSNFQNRMKQHKFNCNNVKSKKHHLFIYQFIRQNGGWDEFDKQIIYECDVKDKTETRMIEQKYITKNECKLNKNNSYLTEEGNKERMKSYREANKETIKEKSKAYYEANKEKIKEYQKAYKEANKEKIKEKKKAYNEANKEKIKAYDKERSKEKAICPNCKKEMLKKSLNRHIKTLH